MQLLMGPFLVIFPSKLNNPTVFILLSKFCVWASAKICYDNPTWVRLFCNTFNSMELNFRTHRYRDEPNIQVWLLHFLICYWTFKSSVTFLFSLLFGQQTAMLLLSNQLQLRHRGLFHDHWTSFLSYVSSEGEIKPVSNFHYRSSSTCKVVTSWLTYHEWLGQKYF